MHKYNYKKILVIFSLGILYIVILLEYEIGIPCIFHELTGLYCPGCGGNRVVLSLIKLNPYQALKYNLLITFLIPFFFIYLFYKYILNGKKRLPKWSMYLLLIVAIIFAILRNTSYFSFLAPTNI